MDSTGLIVAIVRPRSVTARRTPDLTRFKCRLRCAFRSRIPTVSICDYNIIRCSHMAPCARQRFQAEDRGPFAYAFGIVLSGLTAD